MTIKQWYRQLDGTKWCSTCNHAVRHTSSGLRCACNPFRQRYLVMCRVTGGFTGTRLAELKVNGRVQLFDTHEEAEARCEDLRKKMNHQFSTAHFEYWPEPAPEGRSGRE